MSGVYESIGRFLSKAAGISSGWMTNEHARTLEIRSKIGTRVDFHFFICFAVVPMASNRVEINGIILEIIMEIINSVQAKQNRKYLFSRHMILNVENQA